MNSEKSLHLDEDQLIRALVDETDLDQVLQEHLSQCPQCSAGKRQIEKDIERLGQMAERFSPDPGQKVKLPAEKPRKSIWWSWQLRTAFGVAAAAVFVIFFIGMPPLFDPIPGERSRMYTQEMLEDEEFMKEVSMLAENALPAVYLDMAGESDPEFNEEFMQFLIPAIEEDPLTYDSGTKGVEPC